MYTLHIEFESGTEKIEYQNFEAAYREHHNVVVLGTFRGREAKKSTPSHDEWLFRVA